ncbi:MAG TPA: hypothetical protein VEH57_07795 [Thermoplasmata archaeon]|nr:hypothetical protein [Thermoplasmata archaeon]
MPAAENLSLGGAAGDVGFPVLRSGEEVDRLRRSVERPPAVGRYVLAGLGAVTLGSGAGLVLAHYSSLAFAILAFGLLLMVLGAVEHLLYLRGRAHWPEQMLLFEDGLELVLHNSEVRAAEWSDPHLDLEVHARALKSGDGAEYLLLWRMDRKVPPCSLTPEGFERLRAEAVRRDLHLQQYIRGSGRRELRVYTIGPAVKPPPPKSPADWGPKTP